MSVVGLFPCQQHISSNCFRPHGVNIQWRSARRYTNFAADQRQSIQPMRSINSGLLQRQGPLVTTHIPFVDELQRHDIVGQREKLQDSRLTLLSHRVRNLSWAPLPCCSHKPTYTTQYEDNTTNRQNMTPMVCNTQHGVTRCMKLNIAIINKLSASTSDITGNLQRLEDKT